MSYQVEQRKIPLTVTRVNQCTTCVGTGEGERNGFGLRYVNQVWSEIRKPGLW